MNRHSKAGIMNLVPTFAEKKLYIQVLQEITCKCLNFGIDIDIVMDALNPLEVAKVDKEVLQKLVKYTTAWIDADPNHKICGIPRDLQIAT